MITGGGAFLGRVINFATSCPWWPYVWLSRDMAKVGQLFCLPNLHKPCQSSFSHKPVRKIEALWHKHLPFFVAGGYRTLICYLPSTPVVGGGSYPTNSLLRLNIYMNDALSTEWLLPECVWSRLFFIFPSQKKQFSAIPMAFGDSHWSVAHLHYSHKCFLRETAFSFRLGKVLHTAFPGSSSTYILWTCRGWGHNKVGGCCRKSHDASRLKNKFHTGVLAFLLSFFLLHKHCSVSRLQS